MLIDSVPFADVWRLLRGHSNAGVGALVRFFERRLGARFVYDRTRFVYGMSELADVLEIADSLQRAGIIGIYGRTFGSPDEPRIYEWYANYGSHVGSSAGGVSCSDDRSALVPALAEGLERYLWTYTDEYFEAPITARLVDMQARKDAVMPSTFVGFSEAQRSERPQLMLHDDDVFLWIRGSSLTEGRTRYVPAQVVSGHHGGRVLHHQTEKRILTPITTGIATGPTKAFAQLNGTLECIERDALMIMWSNQLTLPRVDLVEIAAQDPALSRLLIDCTQYRLRVDAISLITDAPTYVIGVVVQDDTGVGPRITLGLKAHRNIAHAVEGALCEALRARRAVGFHRAHTTWNPQKPPSEINHAERMLYWQEGERYQKLDWLVQGEVSVYKRAVWESDSVDEHLARICGWARDKQYEMIAFDVGCTPKNCTAWHVEMIVMPQLQPMHQDERFQYLGGQRLLDIPKQFGYTPRDKPYSEHPHPFA